jgi:hypothetical protein
MTRLSSGMVSRMAASMCSSWSYRPVRGR